MFETVYLTGAAGTGKSTLARTLTADERYAVFEYGAELTKRASALDPTITQADIREHSQHLVMGHHVTATDEALQEFVALQRNKRHVIIDSHAVTKEPYGFRAVPFSPRQLETAAISRIVVLHCRPEVLMARIDQNPEGRPRLSHWEAEQHISMQASVALAYAAISGIPIHLLDCDIDADSLRSIFVSLIGSDLH